MVHICLKYEAMRKEMAHQKLNAFCSQCGNAHVPLDNSINTMLTFDWWQSHAVTTKQCM